MNKKIVGLVLIGSVLALCFGGAVALVADSGKDDPPATLVKPAPKTMSAPKTSAAVSDGDWLVGKDIKAGTYRSPGATEGFCAWVVRASEDQNAEVVAVGSADHEDQPQRAAVKNGQVFQTTGCRGWVKQ